MNQAMQKARDTFPAFWKELQSGQIKSPRPSLSLVKAYFYDNADKSGGEHMWVADFSFDGKTISGRLVDRPEHVNSVKEGDQVSFPLSRLSEWLSVRDGKAFGAVTVNLLRSRMSAEERKAHDSGYPFRFD